MYEPGRAHIVVYNWLNLNELSVSLANIGLAEGDHFEVLDVQNLFGQPVYSGVFSATNPGVVLPLNLTETMPVIGENVPKPAVHTDPVFNVFLVRKTGGLSSATAIVQPLLFSHFLDESGRQLFLKFDMNGQRQAMIWDISGKAVFEKTLFGTEAVLDFKSFATGIYLLSVSDGRAARSVKIWVK